MEIKHDHKHNFRESTIKDYEVCIECQTYHSTNQESPVVLYQEQEYWDTGDGKTGRSTIEQQVSNFNCIDDCGISKADRVMQFVPDGGKAALEIAASPGVILQRLIDKGYDTWGVEPSDKYIPFICNQAPQAKVIHGFFPQVFTEDQSDIYDVIIGADIFEHFDNYELFLNSTHRLLTQGGTAIFMSPILLDDGDGFVRRRDFEPSQHAWIHSEKYLKPYLQEMFSEVKFANWINGHQLIILKK
jgi:2-polyprenyl-3-methyl-5-hydroxy-6-metoxy-1,4-benzoquinol methylase